VDTDRNLLFAVLALQADLIDREQFVQACTLWAARKDAPIADLLVRQGWLTPEDCADVERLLDRKLKQHGGDVQASLAEAAGPGARSALSTVGDADVASSLAGLTGPYVPSPPAGAGDGCDAAGRNVLYEEIGRGGIGRVLRGRDPQLRRDLAVKVLRDEYRDDANVQRRFVEEAQIGGQLQHPGLVPVYELGRFADRRPYFTMKLVKGRTLAELLKERPEQARLLGIFEQVCQTVAYAHSKGVIHRDLKPSNVMVGAFGEVQVMDWGLAKILSCRDDDPEATTAGTVIRTLRSDSTEEEDGQTGVVGTPAYMAPEQARGEVEAVDGRADVFGLGAILCVILTGQPPYVGGAEVAMIQASLAEVTDAFARLDQCGADAELVALCKACLAPRREDRPREAGAVAARMAAYQAAVRERLRRAELERAAAEARAVAERRAQRLTVGLAAVLLLLVTGGGGGAWWAQHQQQLREAAEAQRRQEADAEVARAMGEARLLLAQAQAEPLADAGKYRAVLASANKAADLARAGAASEGVQAQAAALVNAMEGEAGAAERDRVLLAALLEVRGPREGPTFRRNEQGLMAELAEPSADEQFRAAFLAWGLDVDAAPAAEAVTRLRARPGPVLTEMIAALDEWAAERRRQRRPEAEWRRVAELAQALDDDPGSKRREDPGSKRRELRELLARGTLERDRGVSALAAALRPVPVPYDVGWGEGRSRLRRLAEETDPAAEPVLGLLTLAKSLRRAGEDGSAERVLRAAVRARPREVVLHYALGQLLAGQRPPRWGEAVECYAVARALRPQLGESLANALVQCDRVSEGLALYERLVTERPDNPWLHYRRGYVLDHQGRSKDAEAAFRAVLRLKPDLPWAHLTLGNALLRQGRLKQAEEAYRAAIGFQPDYPEAHCNLGHTLREQGRYQEAEAACREALRLKPDLPQAQFALGNALKDQGRPKEAEEAYRAALRLQPDHPEARNNLGAALVEQGRSKDAEAAFRAALRLKPDYPETHINLGIALDHQGRLKEAEAACREALRLKPDSPEGHYNLGIVLDHQGRSKDAEAAFRAALRLEPELPQAQCALGVILERQGRSKDAEAACREALRLKPDFPKAHFNLGNALDHQGRPKEAEVAYREATRLQPDYPEAHCNLGHTLRKQGRFTEALEELRRGHALGSKRPGWRYPSAAWVRQCERLVELDRLLPAVLRGEAEPATPFEYLELAYICERPYKGQHAAAARLCADAFAADPRLAADLQQQHRYNAACSAALAAAEQGEDAKRLPDKVQQMLRRRALGWLRDDLAAYAKLAERDDRKVKEAARQRLAHWQEDTDLVSVRDQGALDRLPDNERQDWHRLWGDVAALLKKVEQTK
jgi:serine/threonine-protein kinase